MKTYDEKYGHNFKVRGTSSFPSFVGKGNKTLVLYYSHWLLYPDAFCVKVQIFLSSRKSKFQSTWDANGCKLCIYQPQTLFHENKAAHTHFAVARWFAAQSSVDVQSKTFWITKWCLSPNVFEEYYLWSLFSCISYFASLWEIVFSEPTYISCCIFAIYTFLPRKITLWVSKQWSIYFKSKSCWYLRPKWLDPLLSKFQGQVIIKYDWLHFLMVFLCSLKCIQIFRITSDHGIQNLLWWLLTSRNVFSNL